MSTSTETTPLLTLPSSAVDDDFASPVSKYDRFTPRKKRLLVALVSWCGLMPLFVAGSFLPAVPQIAHDMDSKPEIINLAVSLSLVAAGLGGLSGASYSSVYGRRPVYLCGQSLLCIGSLGVGLARSIPELLVWRFFQTFGAAPGLSVGAGVIGDIYKLEERGTAMGIFMAATLIGPALAPPAGGLAVHYASWRAMQIALSISGLAGFLSMFLFFPETSHAHIASPGNVQDKTSLSRSGGGFVWINPLRPFLLYRSPNMLAISLVCFAGSVTNYVLIVPLAYTIGHRYQIKSVALIGACFLPLGVGSAIGAPLAGRISDKMIVALRKRRGGVWYPEDRLRAALLGAGTFVPISVLLFGLLVQYVPGTVGLVLSLSCLFLNGFGLQMVIGSCCAYLVDILHDRSAESIAVNNAFRAVLVGISIAGMFPLIDRIGVAATNALSAALAWVGFGILCATIRYGSQMRAWANIGYSAAETT